MCCHNYIVVLISCCYDHLVCMLLSSSSYCADILCSLMCSLMCFFFFFFFFFFPNYCYASSVQVNYYLSLPAGGDPKRKVLPKWLKEDLEKIDMKRKKALEKEAQEKSRHREGSGRPTWREVDEEERDRERSEETEVPKVASELYRYSESASSDSVSIEGGGAISCQILVQEFHVWFFC